MGNYDNKRTYNNILAKSDEELVPVLAYNLVNWKNDCIKNGLGKSEILVDTRNLETWHYGGRKILVGFVAVPKKTMLLLQLMHLRKKQMPILKEPERNDALFQIAKED